VPPTRLDNFGWLDPVLKIIDCPIGVRKNAKAYSVYVDNTVNRDKKFLAPLVRYVNWDREYEIEGKRIRKWPKIKVNQHILKKSEQAKLDSLLRKLDQSLSGIIFLTAGLIIDRSDPSGCYPDGANYEKPRTLWIERWNFCQRIEFSLDEYAGLNKAIEETARALAKYIQQLCESDNEPNYRERYSSNLKEIDSQRNDWFYRPYSVNKRSQNRAG
jgi:hypothetical protein